MTRVKRSLRWWFQDHTSDVIATAGVVLIALALGFIHPAITLAVLGGWLVLLSATTD
jgi:hypothetical protein